MRRMVALLVLFLLPLSIGCARRRASGGSEYFPGHDWRTSTPEEQGIDSTGLLRMVEDIQKSGTAVDGIVIVRHGYLVFESYAAPYNAGTAHNLKSSSKSILSALVGIALREKMLDGLDQRVSEVLPEYFTSVDDPRKSDVTLRHLLTMTGGFDWEENSPRSDQLWQSKDWVGAAIGLPLKDAPGERFTYSTALTHLASAAIARRSGMSTRAFAEKYLFDPLGVRAGPWRRDPRGIHWGGSDLFLTPRDMARFGYLYLKKGTWDGRQVVPREWVAESTTAQVNTGGYAGLDDYGYWWWILPGAHAALGFGGQLIVVVPDQDLVVVFTCAGASPLDLFRKYIAPAIRPAALPRNPALEGALSALERELEQPPLVQSPRLPEAAGQISNKSFQLKPNPFGFTGLRVRCTDVRSCSITLETHARNIVVPVGLDGRYKVSRSPGLSDVPVASKGTWIDPDSATPTFLLSFMQLGDPVHMEARFTFEGSRASISLLRKNFDARATELVGTEATGP